jgi:hypothetical protein
MRLSHILLRQHRTPCFPQIDLTLRAILHEKKPRFLVLFSHQTTSYSQILFTHPSYVPDPAIFYDYPTGCPNPSCTDECEMIKFPRRGVEGACVLDVRDRRDGKKKKVRNREMCNWIECDVQFCGEAALAREASSGSSSSSSSSASSEGGSECSEGSINTRKSRPPGQVCSKCKLVKYCSADHQRRDWEEHRRVCVKPPA